MYYGYPYAERVGLVVAGWCYFRMEHPDVPPDPLADRFSEFHGFVEERFRETRTIGWHGIIQQNVEEPYEQFALFLALVTDFAEQCGIGLERSQLPETVLKGYVILTKLAPIEKTK